MPVAFLFAVIPSSRADTTFSVINTASTGNGSLAQAITNANNTPGDDTIIFDIPGTGPHIITLTSKLPDITSNITILNDRPGDEPVNVGGSGASNFSIFAINPGQTVTIAGLTIAQGNPNGMVSHNSTLTVRNCTLSFNTGGSGIYHHADSGGTATLTLLNCTLFNNNASYGGGVGLQSAPGSQVQATFSNCTFIANTASTPGGAAIDNDGQGGTSTLTLVNCTVNQNPNSSGGANVYTINGATTQSLNTIFVHSGSAPNINTTPGGTFTSLGHNLSDRAEGGDSGTAPGGFLNGPGDKRNTNPPLGSLVDNSGPTLTEAIPAASAPLDAGDDAVLGAPYNLTTDERGAARKSGTHVDIGAYEREQVAQAGPVFTVTTSNLHDDGICGPVDCSFPEALNAANANADANTIRFIPGLYYRISSPGGAAGISILHPLTIVGNGARSNLYFSGSDENPVFRIASGAGNVAISDITIDSGRAAGSFPNNCGGAIYNQATLTLTRCSISNSHASQFGGAIYNDGANGNASLTMVDCLIQNNVSGASGSAIFSAGYTGEATTNLTNCTIYGNFTNNGAAAIYNDGTVSGSAVLTLTNCSFAYNRATAASSSIYNDASNPDSFGIASTTVRNTLFYVANVGTDQPSIYNDSGFFSSQGHNLSNDNAGGDGNTGPGGYLNGVADKRNTNPLLGPLANFGGPTDTVALANNSPAVNAGNDSLAPPHDARGYLRSGTSDIGAYEFGGIDPASIADIISIARSASNIVITFQGVAGTTFRLERKATLDGTTIWQSVGGVNDKTPASDGPTQFTDPNAASLGHAFYRVRAVP